MSDATHATLTRLAAHCHHSAVLHQAAFSFYRRINLFFCIPAIALAAVGGAASIANNNACTNTIAIAFGSVSLTSSVLFALHRYLSLGELQRSHEIYHSAFTALGDHIQVHMAIHDPCCPHSRTTYTSLEELAKDTTSRLAVLENGCPTVPTWISKKHPLPAVTVFRV